MGEGSSPVIRKFVSRTGPELDHAALEPHVQADLPQFMTEVEFKKAAIGCNKRKVSRRAEADRKARSRS